MIAKRQAERKLVGHGNSVLCLLKTYLALPLQKCGSIFQFCSPHVLVSVTGLYVGGIHGLHTNPISPLMHPRRNSIPAGHLMAVAEVTTGFCHPGAGKATLPIL